MEEGRGTERGVTIDRERKGDRERRESESERHTSREVQKKKGSEVQRERDI